MKRRHETLDTISKRKMIAEKIRPLLVLIILIPLLSFMFYPMVNMDPRDVDVGIVCLDRGAEFDQGRVNLGNKIVDNIMDPDEDADAASESPIIWTKFDTEEKAQEALDSQKIYGYLVIPRDFSEKQTAQLDALDTLGEALGKMSEGSGKLETAFDAMGSKLGELPKAFKNLATVTSNLAKAAEGLQKANGAIGTEAGTIQNAAGSIAQNDITVSTAISEAKQELDALAAMDPAERTDEDIANAIAAVQDKLSATEGVDNNASIQTIQQNAGMISAQSGALNEGLDNIKNAESGMSSNFSKMANRMDNVGEGTGAMSEAIGTLSAGLGEMSDKMDENVGDAIDTINGDGENADTEDAAKLRFVIDQSRNVMISSTLVGAMNGLSANSGMRVDVEYQHPIPDDFNNMYFVMAIMMLTMFGSMITGILTGFTMRGVNTRTGRMKTIAYQVPLAAVLALCIGNIIPRLVQWISHSDMPADELSKFLVIASFSLIMLIVGGLDLFGLPAVIIPVLIMFCGTAVANLPYAYLPAFWQRYVYPWEPLRFIADGVRNILYWEGTYWSEYSKDMLWLALIGAVLMAFAILKRTKDKKAGELTYGVSDQTE